MAPPTPLARDDVLALRRLLWAPDAPAQDVARWLQQGFAFAPLAAAAEAFPLGLVQGHGGPCGVLAAVQAELLRRALFPDRTEATSVLSLDERRARLTSTAITEAEQRAALVGALASLLVQCGHASGCRPATVRVVSRVATAATEATVSPEAFFDSAFAEVAVETDSDVARVVEALLPQWQSPLGVVLFMWSVLRTKRVETVRSEMDDADSALTGAFGHCSQELLNVLLTGVAASNVFDGSVPMGDTGLHLRGLERRPRIGYLTQLEALRYCQVGNYYKSPEFPVWVIGSASHFSVGFGLDPSLCEASASLILFQRMQRVFKSFDPMETGFMEMGHLADSLQQLGVGPEIRASDYSMAQLCSRLEVAGTGIILWDDYWRFVSVLVHTGDMELALSGKYHRDAPGPSGNASRPKSDEELARELQAQFDAEEGGTVSRAPAAATPVQAVDDRPQRDAKQRFELYYYNGLSKVSHGQDASEATYPQLKKASVVVDATREFIGETIPIELSTASGHGGHAGHPLEDILRTKWPSATFTWEGSTVPSVD